MKLLLLVFVVSLLNAQQSGKIDMHGGKYDTLGKSNFKGKNLSSIFNKNIQQKKVEINDLKHKTKEKIKNIKENINDK